MAGSKETLKDRLARCRQIKISVIGRRSGKTISIPVWFVLEGENLLLLPVQGSAWYRNVIKNLGFGLTHEVLERNSGQRR